MDQAESWPEQEAVDEPRCCDCLNARVKEVNCAYCREGYGHPPGEPVLLSRLMRPRYPRSFRSARTCPKWERA